MMSNFACAKPSWISHYEMWSIWVDESFLRIKGFWMNSILIRIFIMMTVTLFRVLMNMDLGMFHWNLKPIFITRIFFSEGAHTILFYNLIVKWQKHSDLRNELGELRTNQPLLLFLSKENIGREPSQRLRSLQVAFVISQNSSESC